MAMSLCQDQCNMLAVVQLCLGEALTNQLLGVVPGAELQCAKTRVSNPHCLPLPPWGQFEVELSQTQGECVCVV